MRFILGGVYYDMMAVYETRFRDRGIDWLCMKRVSEIGVLIASGSFVLPLLPFVSMLEVAFVIKSVVWGDYRYPHSPSSSSIIPCCIIMSSPSSSYVQVGLDNLERPLNRSPSPHAQVRGFDWSSVFSGLIYLPLD